jgi:hypothetical protein
MDKPADPATPFAEVYQSFLDDLALEGRKPSTIHRYGYNIVRFEDWLVGPKRPVTLASLERSVLIAYRQLLESLPQQPRGSIRRRRGRLVSRHTVHSYLRSIKCLASWLIGRATCCARTRFWPSTGTTGRTVSCQSCRRRRTRGSQPSASATRTAIARRLAGRRECRPVSHAGRLLSIRWGRHRHTWPVARRRGRMPGVDSIRIECDHHPLRWMPAPTRGKDRRRPIGRARCVPADSLGRAYDLESRLRAIPRREVGGSNSPAAPACVVPTCRLEPHPRFDPRAPRRRAHPARTRAFACG